LPKKLENITEEEWEAVCNRCGKCCLIKLQDENTGEIYYTDVVCKYFDFDTCECTQYQNRCTLVPECLKLTKDNVGKIGWMPKSCAYRSLIEGRPRPVREPVSAFCISENLVSDDELEDHILERDDL
jgi:uncharacterized cysteine cluster protein YcgN (CxxCxxCC family)